MPAKNVLPFPSSPGTLSMRASGDKGVIDIRGTIGLSKEWEDYGVEASGTASEFDRELKALGDVRELEVNISSVGGEVFAAMAIHNILVRHPARVVANIDGYAMSSATIIALAADEIRMPENAYLMIHNPAWGMWGDYRDLEKMAADLKKFARDFANIYAARMEDNTGGDRTEILRNVIRMMDDETYLTGAEAKALGLVETVTERMELAACAVPIAGLPGVDPARVPDALRAVLFDSSPTASAGDAAEPVTMSTTPDPIEPTAPATTDEPVVDTPVTEAPAEGLTQSHEATKENPVASAAPVAQAAPATPSFSLDDIKNVVASVVEPLTKRLDKAEADLQREQQLRASGVPQAAWGNQRAADTPDAGASSDPDYKTLTAQQKFEMGCKKMHPGFFGKSA